MKSDGDQCQHYQTNMVARAAVRSTETVEPVGASETDAPQGSAVFTAGLRGSAREAACDGDVDVRGRQAPEEKGGRPEVTKMTEPVERHIPEAEDGPVVVAESSTAAETVWARTAMVGEATPGPRRSAQMEGGSSEAGGWRRRRVDGGRD